MEDSLSVVIPVYKAEATLERSVASVLAQGNCVTEVILVDDGSPDSCPALCDVWARRDERIKVIHQENGGLSAARNAGIEVVTGRWITFVDADDYLSENTYLPLLSLLRQHTDWDILEYSVVIDEGNPARERRLHLEEGVYECPKEYWLEGKAYIHAYAWNKVYRRNLFDKVRFPQGKVFEDALTLPQLLKNCRKVATTPSGTYHYIWNGEGISKTADAKGLGYLLEAYINVLHEWSDTDIKRLQPLYMQAVRIQMEAWRKGGDIVLPDWRERLSLKGCTRKEQIKVIIQKIGGLQALCWIYKLTTLIKGNR